MSVTVLDEGSRRSRKHHRCFHCYRSIAPGETYGFQSNVYDDSAYTLRWHLDCEELAAEYRSGLPPYYHDDGFPPLYDDLADSGEMELLLDAYRGHYPHAVTRMEWHDQMAEIRMADRLAEYLVREACGFIHSEDPEEILRAMIARLDPEGEE